MKYTFCERPVTLYVECNLCRKQLHTAEGIYTLLFFSLSLVRRPCQDGPKHKR